MGKENIGGAAPTRNSNRISNRNFKKNPKDNRESLLEKGNLNSTDNRPDKAKIPNQTKSGGSYAEAARNNSTHRENTRPAPANNRPSSGIPRPQNYFGTNNMERSSSSRESGVPNNQDPTPVKAKTGPKSGNSSQTRTVLMGGSKHPDPSESNLSASAQKPDHPPTDVENRRNAIDGENISNAEMWASVMAKLNAMQDSQGQQSIALQEIKEEIKATNLGFANDITQIWGELEEIQNKFQRQEAKWKDLADFKQGVLDEVRKQVTEQFSSEANQLDEKVKTLLDSRLDETITELISIRMAQVEKRIIRG